MLKKYNFALLFYFFFSVTTLLRDSVTKQSKTDSKEHKSKINFQLTFLPHHPTVGVLHWICMHHCTVSCYCISQIWTIWPCHNFSTIEWFQQTFENRTLVAAKLKHPRKLQETLVWGNPHKALIVLLREVYRVCCCCPTYIFSLDFPMLMQDVGKFQKHCWLLASRMHCNVCFVVKL